MAGLLALIERRGPDECWVWWGGPLDRWGYAILASRPRQRVDRLLILLTGGRIEPGQTVWHRCGNRGCVNPAHLAPVWREEARELGWAATLARRGGRAGAPSDGFGWGAGAARRRGGDPGADAAPP